MYVKFYCIIEVLITTVNNIGSILSFLFDIIRCHTNHFMNFPSSFVFESFCTFFTIHPILSKVFRIIIARRNHFFIFFRKLDIF